MLKKQKSKTNKKKFLSRRTDNFNKLIIKSTYSFVCFVLVYFHLSDRRQRVIIKVICLRNVRVAVRAGRVLELSKTIWTAQHTRNESKELLRNKKNVRLFVLQSLSWLEAPRSADGGADGTLCPSIPATVWTNLDYSGFVHGTRANFLAEHRIRVLRSCQPPTVELHLHVIVPVSPTIFDGLGFSFDDQICGFSLFSNNTERSCSRLDKKGTFAAGSAKESSQKEELGTGRR